MDLVKNRRVKAVSKMHIYYIMSHEYVLPDGLRATSGYSGAFLCRNDPTKTGVKNCGPVPVGKYKLEIRAPGTHNPRLADPVIRLNPFPETETYGRSDFEIHGNNAQNDASHGCIIQIHPIRMQIAAFIRGGDDILEVIAV